MNASVLGRRTAIGPVALAVLATGCSAAGGTAAEGPQRPITEAAVVDGEAWQLDWVSERNITSVADLAVASADEAWAVGYLDAVNGDMAMLRRKGGDWEPAPLPDGVPPAAFGVHLEASSPDNVWLFWSGPDGGEAARWDGARWRAIPVDSSAGYGFQDVAVLAPDDVWTLRGDRDASHWDGNTWRSVELPAAASVIDGRSADDVWAVGSTKAFEKPGGMPVAMHWNGRSWRRTELPRYLDGKRKPGEWAELNGLSVVSGTEVWALGRRGYKTDGLLPEEVRKVFLMRWDGERWWREPQAVGGEARALGGPKGRPVITGEGRGGVLLAGQRHWNGVDEVRTLSAPEVPSAYRPAQAEEYEVQLRLAASHLLPGGRKVIGAGELTFGNAAQGLHSTRAVIVTYELPE